MVVWRHSLICHWTTFFSSFKSEWKTVRIKRGCSVFPPAQRDVFLSRRWEFKDFSVHSGMWWEISSRPSEFLYQVELIGLKFGPQIHWRLLCRSRPTSALRVTEQRTGRRGWRERSEAEMVHRRRVCLRLTCSSTTPACWHGVVLTAGLRSGAGILSVGSTGCIITWTRIMCSLKKSGSVWLVRSTVAFKSRIHHFLRLPAIFPTAQWS